MHLSELRRRITTRLENKSVVRDEGVMLDYRSRLKPTEHVDRKLYALLAEARSSTPNLDLAAQES